MELYYTLLSWLTPEPYKWRRPFGGRLELYRCMTDRRLMTWNMLHKGYCAGHKLCQPAFPTIFELFLIWTGLIR